MNSTNNSILEELRNTVTQGDCLEVMKKLPDGCVDLVLTDPPYGIGEDGKKNHSRCCIAKSKQYSDKSWDSSAPSKEVFDELLRISKRQIVFGANHFISRLPYDSSSWVVWDKDNGKTDFADCELAWTNYPTAVRKFTWKWQGMLQQDMKNKEVREHPTQKPVELMVWCLENYLLKKWKEDRRPIVFDGFAGSGTTGVACKKCGCDYILVEKEKDYCEVINRRLAQDTLF